MIAAGLVSLSAMACDVGSAFLRSLQLDAPTLEFVARIGCADCSDARAITPSALAFLDDGRLASLDRYEPFVRIFRADGDLDVSFGAKGQGPGDIGSDGGAGTWMAGIFLLPEPGGGVSVANPIPPTFDSFDASGTFVSKTLLDLPNAIPQSQAFSLAERTYYRYTFNPMDPSRRMLERCTLSSNAAPVCGSFVDPGSIITPVYPAPSPVRRIPPALATTPSGELVVADPVTYRIWVLDRNGEVIVEARRDIPRREKTAAEIQREETFNQRQPPGRRRQIDKLRTHFERAGVQVDGRGRIWVLTNRYGETDSLFDVFTGDGTFLGERGIDTVVRAGPWHVTPFVVSADRLAVITGSADGNSFIEVYRIVGR